MILIKYFFISYFSVLAETFKLYSCHLESNSGQDIDDRNVSDWEHRLDESKNLLINQSFYGIIYFANYSPTRIPPLNANTILSLIKYKVPFRFEFTDIFEFKEILRKHQCQNCESRLINIIEEPKEININKYQNYLCNFSKLILKEIVNADVKLDNESRVIDIDFTLYDSLNYHDINCSNTEFNLKNPQLKSPVIVTSVNYFNSTYIKCIGSIKESCKIIKLNKTHIIVELNQFGRYSLEDLSSKCSLINEPFIISIFILALATSISIYFYFRDKNVIDSRSTFYFYNILNLNHSQKNPLRSCEILRLASNLLLLETILVLNHNFLKIDFTFIGIFSSNSDFALGMNSFCIVMIKECIWKVIFSNYKKITVKYLETFVNLGLSVISCTFIAMTSIVLCEDDLKTFIFFFFMLFYISTAQLFIMINTKLNSKENNCIGVRENQELSLFKLKNYNSGIAKPSLELEDLKTEKIKIQIN